MIKKIKHYTNNQKYKKIINNFSYLTLINIADRLLPLIVVPYIVRVIGVEKFGIIAFALTIISYGILITRYSFELTATKFISIHRDDLKVLTTYYWNIFATRIVLFGIVSIIFLLLLFSFERFYLEAHVFLFTYILLFADVLMPLWFFRGLEEMKYIAIFNIVAKLVYALSVLILLDTEEQYIWIPLLNSLSLLLAGFYAQYFVRVKFGIVFVKPSITQIVEILKEGKDIFFSNISVSLYSTINTILLGVLTTYSAVGFYSLAEAIYNAFNTIIRSYVLVIYPHLARYIENLETFYAQAKKFFWLYVVLLFVATVVLYLLSDFIITLLYGDGKQESIYILQVLALSTLPVSLGGFFTSYLSLKSEYKAISSITFKTMLLSLVLVVPMILTFEARGVAYLFLLLSLYQLMLNLSYNREILQLRKK